MNHKEFSKKGGRSKSDAKREAARRNWQKAAAALAAKRAAKSGGQSPDSKTGMK